MKFNVEQQGKDLALIMRDGNTVAGSIAKVDDKWRVEFMWTGPTGDITYEATSMPAALAFVDGVEKTLDAMGALTA
jgi:N-acetylglucosamine-6-phosphate deacetylase